MSESEQVGEWQQFLLAEGLDILATYRAIQSPAVRRILIRLMAMTAEAEKGHGVEELDEELALLLSVLTDMGSRAKSA